MTVDINRHEEDLDGSSLAEDDSLLGSGSTLNAQNDIEAEAKAKRIRTLVIMLIVGLIVAVDLPSVLQSSPMLRIIEDIYCKQYHQKNDPSKFSATGQIEESLCKIDSVQAEVAFLKGWMSCFNHLPGKEHQPSSDMRIESIANEFCVTGLFLAVPFGMLADKYGRKWLLVLNIVQLQLRGCWMYLVCRYPPRQHHDISSVLTLTFAVSFPDFFPIRLLWLEAILGVLGGGSMVATALLFVIVSDVTPSSQT